MRSRQKKIIVFIAVTILMLLSASVHKSNAITVKCNNYVVLVQQKNGSWKSYQNMVEVSDHGYLMVKAKRISRALGFTYEINQDGTFTVSKKDEMSNTYTKNRRDYIFCKGTLTNRIYATNEAYLSKDSNYNVCTVSSLRNLVHYRCFPTTSLEEYKEYDGVICFSKYEEIPDEVPIVEINSVKEELTPTPIPEPASITIEGVEFTVRKSFLPNNKVLSDWGGTTKAWSELELELDHSIIDATDLWYDSKTIGFTHQGTGFDGIFLSKTKQGYQIKISVQLNGSVLANQNASVLKAMIATFSSNPTTVYEAVYDSFTSTDTHGINKDNYIPIGDCKIKIGIKNGVVTYYFHENK